MAKYCAKCKYIRPVLKKTDFADLSHLCKKCKRIPKVAKSPCTPKGSEPWKKPTYHLLFSGLPDASTASIIRALWSKRARHVWIHFKEEGVRIQRIQHIQTLRAAIVGFADPRQATDALEAFKGGVMIRVGKGNHCEIKAQMMDDEMMMTWSLALSKYTMYPSVEEALEAERKARDDGGHGGKEAVISRR